MPLIGKAWPGGVASGWPNVVLNVAAERRTAKGSAGVEASTARSQTRGAPCRRVSVACEPDANGGGGPKACAAGRGREAITGLSKGVAGGGVAAAMVVARDDGVDAKGASASCPGGGADATGKSPNVIGGRGDPSAIVVADGGAEAKGKSPTTKGRRGEPFAKVVAGGGAAVASAPGPGTGSDCGEGAGATVGTGDGGIGKSMEAAVSAGAGAAESKVVPERRTIRGSWLVVDTGDSTAENILDLGSVNGVKKG